MAEKWALSLQIKFLLHEILVLHHRHCHPGRTEGELLHIYLHSMPLPFLYQLSCLLSDRKRQVQLFSFHQQGDELLGKWNLVASAMTACQIASQGNV